jgi:thiol-disulfide isomerase/thioredoxin
MDRLPALARGPGFAAFLVVAAALAAACGTEDAGTAPPPSRVNAVKATKPLAGANEWCDVYYAPGKGPRLVVPQVEDARTGGTVAGPSGDGWIWINLWATWCGPCLREMPLITRWMETLKRDGLRVDLWFLSVDEEASVLRSFLSERPAVTPYNSLRLVRQETLHPWLGALGLPPDTAIPVNVIVAPGGGVRCVRTGAINDGHYPTIRTFLGDGQ